MNANANMFFPRGFDNTGSKEKVWNYLDEAHYGFTEDLSSEQLRRHF